MIGLFLTLVWIFAFSFIQLKGKKFVHEKSDKDDFIVDSENKVQS